ncbi:hypothetical protein [Rhizobium sp. BR 315]|uniref:hypothetical protein n=1 Tax=Rhizobium sp. BR 315 TaxID=3040014 RepID=UPI003D340F48
MSNIQRERHPFLDDLTVDAELTSSVLRGPVIGRHEIKLAVDTVGTFYASQIPSFSRLSALASFLNTRRF